MNFGVPYNYDHDALEYAMVSQTVNQTGGYLSTSHLGAPFGQNLHEFPYGADNLNIELLHFFNGATGDPSRSINLLLLVGYPLAALVAFASMRRMRISRSVSALGSVLIAFAPYHQARAGGHLFLSSYFMVPFGVMLVVTACSNDAPLVGWRTRRDLPVLLGCAALASTGAYYALFTVILLGIVSAAAAIGRRSIRPLRSAVTLGAVIVGVLALNLMPSLVWRVTHDANNVVAARSPVETELYGLKVTAMLMPVPNHRVAPLATIGSKYVANSPLPSENGQQLGVIGSLGFLGLIGSIGIVLFRRRTQGEGDERDPSADRFSEWESLRVLVLAAILLSTIGGLSYVLSAGGLSELRGWNRMSIVVMVACVFAVALVIDRACGRMSVRSFRMIVGLVLVVGVFDQVGVVQNNFHVTTEREFASDRTFFTGVSTALGGNGAVLQLPFVSYPETPPINKTGAFDPVAAYLHAPELHWSFGGMRGSVPAWQERLNAATPDDVATQAIAMGFFAIVVDHNGFADRGSALSAGFLQIGALAGATSPDGRYQWFDLRPAKSLAESRGVDLEAMRRALTALPPAKIIPHRQTPGDPNSPVVTG